jgi:hypothetical protein
MIIPDIFYYYERRPGYRYVKTPTGAFEIRRLLENRPCWLKASTNFKKSPKQLILNDWSRFSWSEEKMQTIGRIFSKLMQQGFSIYSVKFDRLLLLTPDSIEHRLTSFKDNKSIILPEDLYKIAAQDQIARDQIHLLDDYWIECLYFDDYQRERSIPFSVIDRLNYSNRQDVLQVLDHALPRLAKIQFRDRLPGDTNLFYQSLKKRYSRTEAVVSYSEVTVDDDNDLIHHPLNDSDNSSSEVLILNLLEPEDVTDAVLIRTLGQVNNLRVLESISQSHLSVLKKLLPNSLSDLKTISLRLRTPDSSVSCDLESIPAIAPMIENIHFGFEAQTTIDTCDFFRLDSFGLKSLSFLDVSFSDKFQFLNELSIEVLCLEDCNFSFMAWRSLWMTAAPHLHSLELKSTSMLDDYQSLEPIII